MKKKYIVTTRSVHAYDYEVVAESAEEAKQKVFDDEGIPIPTDEPFENLLCLDEWDVRLFAPLSSTKFPKSRRV